MFGFDEKRSPKKPYRPEAKPSSNSVFAGVTYPHASGHPR